MQDLVVIWRDSMSRLEVSGAGVHGMLQESGTLV